MTVAIQSILFVPGTRPDRFAKALASGADIVCIDMEDAVPAADKAGARAAALAAIADLADARLALRINGVMTRAGLADVLALADVIGVCGARPPLLLVPMVESPVELRLLAGVLADPAIRLVPLIETVAGLRAADAIAADPAAAMLMFGGGDFAAQLGTALAWEPLAAARAQIVMAAAGAGKGAIDVPFIHLDDGDGLARECAAARTLGFAAKAAIHPSQIAAIHAAFRPSAAEVAEAEAALAAFAAAGGGAVRHNGRMLEAPLIARYRALLAHGRGKGEQADA